MRAFLLFIGLIFSLPAAAQDAYSTLNVGVTAVNGTPPDGSGNPTATPTTTTVAIKCWIVQTTTLSLAIVTTGLTLAPATPANAGTVVMALAIPPTQ